MTASGVLRFLGPAALGAVVVVAGSLAFAPPRSGPPSGALPTGAASTAASATPGTPLQALPATQTLQLVSYVESAGQTQAETPPETTPWLSAGIPRVPAITQFDGGPLGNVNCAMASGAMLARLTYGIVTTGSQLRALQDDQEGGTSMRDVQTAVDRGWGVRFRAGVLSPLQLRALLYAGAGAEIGGAYGEIPVSLRLQKDFTAGHSIYLDGFREAGPEGPAAYYVIDPLGHTWSGYRGGWWPADIVERFGTVFGSGGIIALWGFPGGTAPREHPILPLSAYPSAGPSVSPSPGTSPGPSPSPLADPMPTEDVGEVPDTEQGTTPPATPELPTGVATASSSGLSALLARCTASPAPGDCPPGLIGRIVPAGATGPSQIPTLIRLRYVTQLGPGIWQIVFEAPEASSPAVWVWPADPEGRVAGGTVEPAILDGLTVQVATVTADPTLSFTFVITTAGDDQQATSEVGSVTVP